MAIPPGSRVPYLRELKEKTALHREESLRNAELDDKTVFVKALRESTPTADRRTSFPSPSRSAVQYPSTDVPPIETKMRGTSVITPRSPKSPLGAGSSSMLYEQQGVCTSPGRPVVGSGRGATLVLVATAADKVAVEQGVTRSSSSGGSPSHTPGRTTPQSERRHLNPLHPDFPTLSARSDLAHESASSSSLRGSQEPEMTPRSVSKGLVHGFLQYTGAPESPLLRKRESSQLADPFDICNAHLIKLAFSEDLEPKFAFAQSPKDLWTSPLKPYLELHMPQCNIPARCPENIQENILRLRECQQMMKEGISWKADDVSTMRNTKISQLWRGLGQYESITINGQELPYLLSDEDKQGYDETLPHAFNDIPERIRNFYQHLLQTLEEQQFPFYKAGFQESLERLVEHKQDPKDRNIRMFLSMASMGMWGCCSTFLVKKFPRLFNYSPYVCHHNRIGKIAGIGVPGATACEMIVNQDEIRLIQKKKFRAVIKATGSETEDRPVATFTLAWDVPLPKSGAKFEGTLKMSDFVWHPDLSTEAKGDFMDAFFDLKRSPG